MELPKRKPNRLPQYNYSSDGVYFITICTHERRQILSQIPVGAIHESPETQLTICGQIAEQIIHRLSQRFGIQIDNYVIMPNHIHLLLTIDNGRAIHESPLRKRSLIGNIIGYLKMNVSKELHKNGFQGKIWQRSFHDHVIRNQADYNRIYEYIRYNPLRWQDDCFF